MNPDLVVGWLIIAASLAAIAHEANVQRRDRRTRRNREAATARTIAYIRSLPLSDAIAAEYARTELDDELRGMGS